MMDKKVYFAVFMLAAAAAGCSKKMVKIDRPKEPAAQAPAPAPQQEESEAALRGKEFFSSPEVSPVYFEYDRTELTAKARELLRKNAGWLEENPEAEVKIEGHCDERGTTEYNLGLGVRRANAVRDFYKAMGIAIKRLSTISYGEDKPACAQSGDSCWKKNRRAETLVRVPSRT